MLIQILLIAVVLGLLLWVARQRATAISAMKKIGLSLLAVVMIVSVLFPQITTAVANVLGVGRGADLLLYVLTPAFVVFALTQYTRNQANRRLTFSLARRIALIEAEARYARRLTP